ncbi:hypothetical protein TNCV_4675071 [Trichonephila clavipes]|nr:hypothetical protein TNCV_4675071 [Trichonephila clavipes]
MSKTASFSKSPVSSSVIPRSLLLRIPPAGSTGGIHGRLLPLPRRENSSSGQPRTERGRSAPHKVSTDAVKASRRPRLGRWDSPCEISCGWSRQHPTFRQVDPPRRFCGSGRWTVTVATVMAAVAGCGKNRTLDRVSLTRCGQLKRRLTPEQDLLFILCFS